MEDGSYFAMATVDGSMDIHLRPAMVDRGWKKTFSTQHSTFNTQNYTRWSSRMIVRQPPDWLGRQFLGFLSSFKRSSWPISFSRL
jgi:hypothetical protein